MRYYLLAALLVGCGPGERELECQSDLFKSVKAIKPINCANFYDNTALAQKMLANDLHIPYAEQRRIFSKVEIVVRSENRWNGVAGPNTAGTFYPVKNKIELGYNSGALLHEMLHAYEEAIGKADFNDAHRGWGLNGYYIVQTEFWALTLFHRQSD